jgi:hypothetical protein
MFVQSAPTHIVNVGGVVTLPRARPHGLHSFQHPPRVLPDPKLPSRALCPWADQVLAKTVFSRVPGIRFERRSIRMSGIFPAAYEARFSPTAAGQDPGIPTAQAREAESGDAWRELRMAWALCLGPTLPHARKSRSGTGCPANASAPRLTPRHTVSWAQGPHGLVDTFGRLARGFGGAPGPPVDVGSRAKALTPLTSKPHIEREHCQVSRHDHHFPAPH